jgi:hypothetical protein
MSAMRAAMSSTARWNVCISEPRVDVELEVSAVEAKGGGTEAALLLFY